MSAPDQDPPIDARTSGPDSRAQLDMWASHYDHVQRQRVAQGLEFALMALGIAIAFQLAHASLARVFSQESADLVAVMGPALLAVITLLRLWDDFMAWRNRDRHNPYRPMSVSDEAQAIRAIADVLDDPITLAYLDAVRYEPRALTLHDLEILRAGFASTSAYRASRPALAHREELKS